MRLVVDSNIIFSALINPGGKTAEVIFLKDIELFSVRTLEKEIFEYKKEILEKSRLSEVGFELFYEVLLSKIIFIETAEISEFSSAAKEVCPDSDDVSFFALCLAKNLPLWSNDKELNKQNVIQIIRTEELVKMV